MSEPEVLPAGSWPSPITVDVVLDAATRLGESRLDGADAYWLEGRPSEGGRQVLVRLASGAGGPVDVTPPGFNARTMVHEYGGGAYAVGGGLVVFSNLSDGRLYRQDLSSDGTIGAPAPLTPEGPFRYADIELDLRRRRAVVVREDHSAGDLEPASELVSVDLDGRPDGSIEVLVRGHDFVAAPRLNPDGTSLAWITWTLPDMPWDATVLWVAPIGPDGRPGRPMRIAGGPGESVLQPEWAPDGTLAFVSDRSGWWNLYGIRPGGAVVALAPLDAEFADAAWLLAGSGYGWAADGSILAAARSRGRDRLYRVGTPHQEVSGARDRAAAPEELTADWTELASLRVAGELAIYVAASPSTRPAIVLRDLATGRERILKRPSGSTVDPAYVSPPDALTFPASGGEAHALYYPPHSPDAVSPAGEQPPLVVRVHGGPTANASTALSLEIQYLTSRGFAVVDVDYGGSTGYGRAFRSRLEGAWGVVDLDDTVAAVRHLVERGMVDPTRVAITGGSAGGYTVLCAAAFRPDVFAAGVSLFGVADLELLTEGTHKFESKYEVRLVGPYPERADLYRERSPIHAADRIDIPLLIIQGAEDRVVPISQAERIVEALAARGRPHAYLLFPGEGHGFRSREALRRAFEAEFSFYAQIFGFRPADPLEPVLIHHARQGTVRTDHPDPRGTLRPHSQGAR